MKAIEYNETTTFVNVLNRSIARLQHHPLIAEANKRNLNFKTIGCWLTALEIERRLFSETFNTLNSTCNDHRVINLLHLKRLWEAERCAQYLFWMKQVGISPGKIEDNEGRFVGEIPGGVKLSAALAKFATFQCRPFTIIGFLLADEGVSGMVGRTFATLINQNFNQSEEDFYAFLDTDETHLADFHNVVDRSFTNIASDLAFGIRLKERATEALFDDVYEMFPSGYQIPPYDTIHWR